MGSAGRASGGKHGKGVDRDGEGTGGDHEEKGGASKEGEVEHPDPEKDTTDCTPFAFKPLQLASLVDPKNVHLLTEMGGVEGLVRGLGTHRTKGLSGESLLLSRKDDHQSGAGDGAGQRHEREPKGGTVESDADTEKPPLSPPGDAPHDPDAAYTAALDVRHRVYGLNLIPTRTSKSLLTLMWLALKDKVLVLLTIAAVVSLSLGLFQDFGQKRPTYSCGNGQTCTQAPVDWVEGVAIMAAVFIVVVVGSLNDWQKEKQFKVLNEKKEDRTVKVMRAGVERVVNVKDVVVGDVALLEPGEVIPCDGVFLGGHNVRCDESGATGESDAIKKVSYEECVKIEDVGAHTDCFVVSGSKVLEGVGSYVVIAVGEKSFNGRIMMALRGDTDNTPLQIKLNHLAELIAKLGSAAGLILFSCLLIRFFVQLGTDNPHRTPNQKGLAFVQILIISVTLIVVAVPEGLPLAVTLALAFATKRMTAEKLLVRVLGSCETMANASVVCTDKTGTLTQNVMTVVAGSVGIHAKFVRRLEDNKARTNAGEETRVAAGAQSGKHPKDFSIDQSKLNSILSPSLRKLFNEAIAINSTAFEDTDPDTGTLEFVGSKTETALLSFAKELAWAGYAGVRTAAAERIVQMIPFSSERKAMGVVVKLPAGRGGRERGWRVYLKGASEILTKRCTRHVVVREDGAQSGAGEDEEVETQEIDALAKDNISRTIIFYANQTLRTIAICYRDFQSWPPRGMEFDSEKDVPYDELACDLTLISITGIEDPLREGVREAVANCQLAGVSVKMCTGDNVLTARSIALQCGIFTPGGIIMEGPVFRQLNDREKLEVVPRLQVLARSSPEDKKILVEKLKELGEIVGVTGDGTNDGPALKTAHVGFSMGIAGTEVAKEASDIILMDDNFASIVKAIMWGRCVNDAVRKFLQFQISVNITAVIVTFVTAVSSAQEQSVLSAVQLLWINIIMDTFAALALATDPASPALLNRKPESKTAPLFSVDMYKQIIGQSAYQTAFTLVFHFLGNDIFNYKPDPNNEAVQIKNTAMLNTLVFNAFVFANIFNSINCRRIDQKKNIFEGIARNYYFIAITLLEIVVQVVIVFVGGSAFQVTRINGRDWAISIALGVLSIPIGFLIRLIPNPPIERLLQQLHILKDPNVLPTERPDESGEWNSAINLVRDNLNTFSSVRGGRMRSSQFVIKSRSARLDKAGTNKLPTLMAMMPTLVASSLFPERAPQSGPLHDPAHIDPSRSSAALWEGKVQLHPDTPKEDPAYKKWGGSRSQEALP
ncbi:calcium-translocating P-type ATPase [Rickenella mellea]|uniref:Calcium-transporting ATPase n=1 Tax=Rickenella mellea TaxID=50990 RepID=A0A4Y7PWV1_9AGAM|nr:calcium-translocating P-type ATPase [Rickenella mellea]